MAKYALKAGVELDILTPAEMQEALRALGDRILAQGQTLTVTLPLQVPANSTTSEMLFTVPPGTEAFLHRFLYVSQPQSTSVVSYVTRNSTTVFDAVDVAATLPTTNNYSRDSAPRIGPGEMLYLLSTNSSATTAVTVYLSLQYTLWPNTSHLSD